MQVELFKSEDVKFLIFKPPAFQKFFAFYGLIRTDTAMLLMDLLILPNSNKVHIFRYLNSHFGPCPILIPDCTATVYNLAQHFFGICTIHNGSVLVFVVYYK
jgi:hypothetical protein